MFESTLEFEKLKEFEFYPTNMRALHSEIHLKKHLFFLSAFQTQKYIYISYFFIFWVFYIIYSSPCWECDRFPCFLLHSIHIFQVYMDAGWKQNSVFVFVCALRVQDVRDRPQNTTTISRVTMKKCCKNEKFRPVKNPI